MTTTRFADHLLTGIHSARPAASAVPAGTLYACSTHGLVYQSDGSSTWSTWATLGATETLPVTIIDAKGDLIAGTAADTAARLAVGSDGQVLTADSASTPGVKWAAAAGSSGAMTQLYSLSLGVAGTFDQSGISGSYNDLKLVLIARGDTSTSVVNGQFTINNDTSTHYGQQDDYWNNTTNTATGRTSRSNFFHGGMPADTAAAGVFGVAEFWIFGYASTTWQKLVYWRTTSLRDVTNASTFETNTGYGIWNQTSAVTRVKFDNSSGNYKAGSILRIYGIA